jgi:hypothetical protein
MVPVVCDCGYDGVGFGNDGVSLVPDSAKH